MRGHREWERRPLVGLSARGHKHADAQLAAAGGPDVMTRALVIMTIVGCAATVGHAQDRPVFRSGVEVVELDVSVTRGGQPVAGLTAHDFALTDNGVLQVIDSVTLDQLPLSILLALDTSLSVAGDRLKPL